MVLTPRYLCLVGVVFSAIVAGTLGRSAAEEKKPPNSTSNAPAPIQVTASSQAAASIPGAAAPRIDFNRDIRPIFSQHCYACHGPDKKQVKAGLRLDSKDSAFRELDSGVVAIVPEDLDESELFQRISSDEEDFQMPPRKAGKALSPKQIDLLKQWILQGADWQGHWAYIAPQPPDLPNVKDKSWPRNGIDYFILARLEAEGLQPSPLADKATLLRRVTFDLTGLPPTLEELDAFLADQSPQAYEQVVDRLLAASAFGERMAQNWLDMARYADTNGYHIDNHRDMWKYREWVINAFNQNKPFDEFTVEQLAGDLLPEATIDQLVASGFNRNHMINFEGGADADEYLSKYVIDRVTTTSTVWLATTMGCAECHEHKYDPFTQQDFYQLYAFFNNVPEKGLDGQRSNPIPSIQVPSTDQTIKKAAFAQQSMDLDARIAAELAKIDIKEPTIVEDEVPPQRRSYVWVDDALPAGAVAKCDDATGSWNWVSRSDHTVFSGDKATLQTADGLSEMSFTKAELPVRIGAGDKLFTYVFLDPENPPREIMLQFYDGRLWRHRAYWGENLIDLGAINSPSRLPLGPLPATGKWVRLEVDTAEVGLGPGAEVHGWSFTQYGGTVYWDLAGIVTATHQGPAVFDSQIAWERFGKSIVSTGRSKLPKNLQETLKHPREKRSDKQRQELRNHYLQFFCSHTRNTFASLNEEQEQLKQKKVDLDKVIPQVMVMRKMEKPRDTFILVRGNFQVKGEKVTPQVPKSLPPLPEGMKPDRLALATWLVDPGHPLTSRVTVNRYWQQYFGTGIVKTSDDFGSQGEWPTHPELLDHLATEFIRLGWDVKALQKQIVMSATYRQISTVTPELLARDPYNRLLARGPRFRLSAEMIRDNALAVSGLLDRRIGGSSVRPYQPAGLWKTIGYSDSGYSSQVYEQSKGRDLYRRGIYVYWKRALPYPSMITFDAPNREVCTDRRPLTNTPLQALVLLNDPVYVEAARVLGQLVMQEGGTTTSERLNYMYRLCTARNPHAHELEILTGVYETQLARFTNNPEAAQKLTTIGDSPRSKSLNVSELAAWTTVGNVILNLDETMTKG